MTNIDEQLECLCKHISKVLDDKEVRAEAWNVGKSFEHRSYRFKVADEFILEIPQHELNMFSFSDETGASVAKYIVTYGAREYNKTTRAERVNAVRAAIDDTSIAQSE